MTPKQRANMAIKSAGTCPDVSLAECIVFQIDEATKAQTAALEAARYELVTLSGLHAFDGEAPGETWVIDTRRVVAQLDAVLPLVEVAP